MFLLIFLFASLYSSIRAVKNDLGIVEIYNKFKKKEIKWTKVKGEFVEVYPDNPQSNTRKFIYNSDLRYSKIDNGKYSYDEIEIFKKSFLLITYDYMLTGETLLLHANPDMSTVYQFEYNHKRFLCMTLEVTKSGSWQEISDYALFDITDINHIIYYTVSGRYASTDAFGDYNGDGVLDFALVDYYKGGFEKLKKQNKNSLYYWMEFLTLNQGEVEPIAGLSKVII